jgi:hypothetical protein
MSSGCHIAPSATRFAGAGSPGHQFRCRGIRQIDAPNAASTSSPPRQADHRVRGYRARGTAPGGRGLWRWGLPDVSRCRDARRHRQAARAGPECPSGRLANSVRPNASVRRCWNAQLPSGLDIVQPTWTALGTLSWLACSIWCSFDGAVGDAEVDPLHLLYERTASSSMARASPTPSPS